MSDATVTESASAPVVSMKLVVPALVGAAVAVSLGVYGSVHDPTGEATIALFFSSTLSLKAWFTTVAVLLAVVQVYTATRMYGKTSLPPRELPVWWDDLHRLSGIFAFLFSLPVAYHCLWSLGFNTDTDQTRRLIHSIAGCFFYGVFAAKMLIIRIKGLPGWTLPVVGGTIFTALVVLWSTSAFYFLTGRLPGQ